MVYRPSPIASCRGEPPHRGFDWIVVIRDSGRWPPEPVRPGVNYWTASPPLGDPSAPQTPKGLGPELTAYALVSPQLTVSATKRTEPSRIPTFTPPG